jgi:hypothetical protein
MTNDHSNSFDATGHKSQKFDSKRPLTPQFKKEMSKSGGEVEGKNQEGDVSDRPKVDLIVLMG